MSKFSLRVVLFLFSISTYFPSFYTYGYQFNRIDRSVPNSTKKNSIGRVSNTMHASQEKSDISLLTPSSNVFSEKRLTGALLVLSYMSIIISVMALPSVMQFVDGDPLLKGKFVLRSTADIVSTATMFTMGGKFIFGTLTDTIGGTAMLTICMTIMGASLAGCATSSSLYYFSIHWILISFFYSSSWGAVGSIIRSSFEPEEWAAQIGYVASGSRIGAIISSLLYGAVISATSTWRTVFWTACAIQFAASLIFSVSLSALWKRTGKGDKTVEEKKVDVEISSQQMLWKVANNPRFWLALLGKSCLMMTGQFMSFLPLYLSTGLKMPAHKAAANSALFALGSLLSNIFGIQVYGKLSAKDQVRTIASFNVVGFLLASLLALQALSVVALTEVAVLLVIFLWGFAWSLPFYIPAGVMALRLGGPSHAALLTNLFDAAGFLAAAAFSLPAGRLGALGGKNWFPVLSSLAMGHLVATVAMSLAERPVPVLEQTDDLDKSKTD